MGFQERFQPRGERELPLELPINLTAPQLLLIRLDYSISSTLSFGDQEIEAAEGTKQGDSLNQSPFSHRQEESYSASRWLHVWFMEDGTLAGSSESLSEDLSFERARGIAGRLSYPL